MFKVGDEVSVKGEITKVCESGVVVKAHFFGEAYFDRSNMDLIDKTYEQGLADAWELAKKILYGNDKQLIEIFELNVELAFFDLTHKRAIINDHTPEETLAKIEAYEKEKKFCVGDEIVTSMGETFIILALADGEVYGYSNDGKYTDFPVQRIEDYTESGRAEKTGKHIDIEGLLKQIGE